MKVVIVGATGNTGLQLVEQAIQKGHEVTAIVRNEAKLASFKDKSNFKIVKANLMDPNDLSPHLENKDCILSALGAPGIHIFTIKFYLESMQSLVQAMRKANLKRIICITAFYTKPDPNYPNVYKFVLRPMIGRQLDSMFEMEEWMFKECSDLDWTIVRPPRLLTTPKSELQVIAKESTYYSPDTLNQIPVANVASFMLDEIEKNEFLKKAVAIDLPK